jgi:pilus assembly protein CpaF
MTTADSAPGLGDLFGQASEGSVPVDTKDPADNPLQTASEGVRTRQARPLRLGAPTRTRAVPAGVDDDVAPPSLSPNGTTAQEAASAVVHVDIAATPDPLPVYPNFRHEEPVTPAAPSTSIADIFSEQRTGPGGFPKFTSSRPNESVPGPNPVYAPAPQQPVQYAWEQVAQRRFQEAERFWPIVDRIMAVAGSDAEIQRITPRLELIADADADRVQRDALFDVLKPKLASASILIPDPKDIPIVLEMAYDELVGISVLGALWRDPSITEIMVDRWNKVTLERDGKLVDTSISFRDPDHANSVARSLALRLSDRAVSRSINLVTAELPSARVQFAYGPVVRGGLSITIRKFRKLLGLEDLLRFRAIDQEMIDFLHAAVVARAGILISGGTGTGKTTIINLLSNFIPTHERVVTIEDAFELRLSNSHVVSLQTKEAASADDSVSVTLADLLRATLRMRPDRIIVGEIREGEGATVMLTAANTGHEGTMTTIHANSADMALNERLVDLVRQSRGSTDEAILRTIVSAFDIVVQVSRGRRGNRYIAEIALVERASLRDGAIHPHPIFIGEDDEAGGARFRRVGSLGPETVLARKFVDADVDAERWIEQEG